MSSHGLSGSLFFVTESTTCVESAVCGGVSHVVLRMPQATAREVYDRAVALAPIVQDAGARLIISDRVDVTLALPGAGIHLGGRSLPVDRARAIAPDRLLSVSVHSVERAVHAAVMGADYVMFGHVYDTPSHPGESGRGIEMLREVVRAVEIPVIAIGGITEDRIGEVSAAGASGVAVMRAIGAAKNPEAAARSLRHGLELSRPQ